MPTLESYAVDPKEWLAGIVNHTFNQFTMTPENTTVIAVDEVTGQPHKAKVSLQIDRNVGMAEGLGLVPHSPQYIYRDVTIVRRVGADLMKQYGVNNAIHLNTATAPGNVSDIVNLLNAQYNLNISDFDVHETPVTGFGVNEITFKAKSYAFFGRIRVYVANTPVQQEQSQS